MNVLIVMPDFPYPPNHGGRSDMLYRLQSISSTKDVIVDVIATTGTKVKPDEYEYVKKYVRNIVLVERNKRLTLQLSMKPYQVVSRESLRNVQLAGQHYEMVLLEGDYVGDILLNKQLMANTIAIRVHNDEQRYFKSLADASTGLRKLYYLVESLRFKHYTNRLYKKANAHLYISKDECTRSLPCDAYRVWLPPAVDLVRMTTRPLGTGRVLYVGSLFMPNNVWSLKWYIDNVHLLLKKRNPTYRFVVAGNVGNGDISWLKNYPDIEIHSNPTDDDLEKIYESASVFIAPIFHGAGVKIKNINAIANGLPVVTTAVGNEGSGLVDGMHVIVANNSSGFVDGVSRLLTDIAMAKRMVQSGQEFVRKYYDQRAVITGLLDVK